MGPKTFLRFSPRLFFLFAPPPLPHFAPVKRAIYAGSFDPVTNGHLDVLERAARLFDEVIIAVVQNAEKQALFTAQERVELLHTATSNLSNVRVAQFTGLLVDFAKNEQADAMIRGLRAISDFEFEFQMALMNRRLEPGLETLFLMPREDYSYVSSRLIKEIAALGGKVEAFVPPCVVSALRKRFPK
jgi:pantetheine-phosphate adenylyltransferase